MALWNGWISFLQDIAKVEAAHTWVFWVSLIVVSLLLLFYSAFVSDGIRYAVTDGVAFYMTVEWVLMFMLVVGTAVSLASVLATAVAMAAAGICLVVVRLIIGAIIFR